MALGALAVGVVSFLCLVAGETKQLIGKQCLDGRKIMTCVAAGVPIGGWSMWPVIVIAHVA